jgi:hypothetical protein
LSKLPTLPVITIYNGKGSLDNGYGYLDNEFSNKYEKKLKKKKILMNTFLWIVHQRPSNYNRYKLYKILMVLDGISNDNEII